MPHGVDPAAELAILLNQRFAAVEEAVGRIEATLDTLIVWMVQSANSPIRHDEGERLLKMRSGKLRAPESG
jgi:hypothetical protein